MRADQDSIADDETWDAVAFGRNIEDIDRCLVEGLVGRMFDL